MQTSLVKPQEKPTELMSSHVAIAAMISAAPGPVVVSAVAQGPVISAAAAPTDHKVALVRDAKAEEPLKKMLCATERKVDPATGESVYWHIDCEQYSLKVKNFFAQASAKEVIPARDLPDLFNGNFIVGEAHRHVSPKKILAQNMMTLKQKGFEVIFMEHLFYDVHQAQLDHLYSQGEMLPELKKYLEELDNKFGWVLCLGPEGELNSLRWQQSNFMTVVQAAQVAGIRVVAIDLSMLYEMDRASINGEHSANRTAFMNYAAFHIMQYERAKHPNAKWCALMGNTHATTYHKTIGLSQLFGANSMLMLDDLLCQQPEINTTDAKLCANDQVLSTNILIKQHPDVVITLQPFSATLKLPLVEELANDVLESFLERMIREAGITLPMVLVIMDFVLTDVVKRNAFNQAQAVVRFNSLYDSDPNERVTDDDYDYFVENADAVECAGMGEPTGQVPPCDSDCPVKDPESVQVPSLKK